ncbi:MAG TPA: hypothetical protein VGB45_14725 [Abditibacterium sp.]|jgi:hypothetical protein
METSHNWSELEVPGEPGVWNCARHKTTQTRLRCGRCEKPICPKCTVMAPTGARCRDCVSNRSSHMYQIAPRHLALAFGASVGAGVLGAVLTQLAGAFWFWILLYAPAIGPLLGSSISKITGGKRGPKVAFVVSLGLIVGTFGAALAATYLLYAQMGRYEFSDEDGLSRMPLTMGVLLAMTLLNLPLWAFLVLSIVGVWWWLK